MAGLVFTVGSGIGLGEPLFVAAFAKGEGGCGERLRGTSAGEINLKSTWRLDDRAHVAGLDQLRAQDVLRWLIVAGLITGAILSFLGII